VNLSPAVLKHPKDDCLKFVLRSSVNLSPGCCILYSLQSVIQVVADDVVRYIVAVVQANGDEGLKQRLCGILRQ